MTSCSFEDPFATLPEQFAASLPAENGDRCASSSKNTVLTEQHKKRDDLAKIIVVLVNQGFLFAQSQAEDPSTIRKLKIALLLTKKIEAGVAGRSDRRSLTCTEECGLKGNEECFDISEAPGLKGFVEFVIDARAYLLKMELSFYTQTSDIAEYVELTQEPAVISWGENPSDLLENRGLPPVNNSVAASDVCVPEEDVVEEMTKKIRSWLLQVAKDSDFKMMKVQLIGHFTKEPEPAKSPDLVERKGEDAVLAAEAGKQVKATFTMAAANIDNTELDVAYLEIEKLDPLKKIPEFLADARTCTLAIYVEVYDDRMSDVPLADRVFALSTS